MEEKKEQIEEAIELLEKQINQIQKDKKKLDKRNKIQNKLLNQLGDKKTIKKYIEEDEYIRTIVEVFKETQKTLHKATLKDFLTQEELLKYELFDTDEQLENLKKDICRITSTKTLNKKLEELEVLGLITIDEYDISATDKLMKVLEDTRVYKSIKTEKELKIITEDKIIAARLRTCKRSEEDRYSERYKHIYRLDDNTYLVGRKEEDTTDSIKRRIDHMIKQLKNPKSVYCKDGVPRVMREDDNEGYKYYSIDYKKQELKNFETYVNCTYDTTSKNNINNKLYLEEYRKTQENEFIRGNYEVKELSEKDIKYLIEKYDLEIETRDRNIRIYVSSELDQSLYKHIEDSIKYKFSGDGEYKHYQILKY